MSYSDVQLFIDGTWCDGADGARRDIINPATEDTIGTVARVAPADLERAVAAVQRGFGVWRAMSSYDRSKVLRGAATLLRQRVARIAPLMTMDEGKPLAEATAEVNSCADLLDWFAEEGRRTYGRVIPSRALAIRQMAVRVPVGPVVGFTPWNFPMSQIVRKLGPALAAGCSIIIKGPEDAPASPAELFRALQDAGLPEGVANLVFGDSAMISEYLIPHPAIRKVSFTGSVPVGKKLAALAGAHMKRVTMELGGHAPVIVAADADLPTAAARMVAAKYRNAGQVCNAPTRFLVQDAVHDDFVAQYVGRVEALTVGNGLDAGVTMGPMFSPRQIKSTEALIEDALSKGARLETGGTRHGNKGYFFAPTVLSRVTTDMRAMNEEPFGPITLISRYSELPEAITEANRLPFGLASYAFATSARTVDEISRGVEAGMLSINHQGLGLAETPYGGIRESGYGYEGGTEALEPYTTVQFISHDTAPVAA